MNRPMDKRFWFLKGIKIAVLVVLFIGIVGWLFMLLWNCLIPGIFGLKVLGYWEALGLLVLARIIFGGRGGWGHHGGWKHRLRGRWESMTPEEREKFRTAMKERWCRRN